MFAEKWDMLTDSSSQQPHGIGQAFIAELFGESGWGIDGFARWVKSLCDDYQRRRDLFMDTFQRNVASSGHASAQVPQSGMFVWIKVHLDQHPRYRTVRDGHAAAGPRINIATLMNELFNKIVDSGLIVMPASTFVVVDTANPSATEAIQDVSVSNHPVYLCNPYLCFQRANYFRATFAGTEEVITKGLEIFGSAVTEFFAN
jgi:aromatic amino acid aminotransferase I / 2-aminoadipate transaminase